MCEKVVAAVNTSCPYVETLSGHQTTHGAPHYGVHIKFKMAVMSFINCIIMNRELKFLPEYVLFSLFTTSS